MRYLKIFENFSDSNTVKELWGIDPEDNMRLVISCLEEAGLEGLVTYTIHYAVLERVENRRAPGLPSYSSRYFRSCFIQDENPLRIDDIYGDDDRRVSPSIQGHFIEKLRKEGPSKDFLPVIEVSLDGLQEDYDPDNGVELPEQVFDRIYTERFRDYFNNAYNVESCDYSSTYVYSIMLHKAI